MRKHSLSTLREGLYFHFASQYQTILTLESRFKAAPPTTDLAILWREYMDSIDLVPLLCLMDDNKTLFHRLPEYAGFQIFVKMVGEFKQNSHNLARLDPEMFRRDLDPLLIQMRYYLNSGLIDEGHVKGVTNKLTRENVSRIHRALNLWKNV